MRRAALILLLLGLAVPAPAPATFPGKNGKIAFFHQDQEIYSIDPDGSNLTNLTNYPASDVFPDWSADGRRIVFESGGYPPVPEFLSQLYYMNADGRGKTQVTTGISDFKSEPTWSPDGTRIAFISTRQGEFTTIKVINVDGTDERILCCGPGYGDGTHIETPSWSPDGTRIVFARFIGLTHRLWTIHPDGTGLTRICCDSITAFHPDWSPDGRTILFEGGSRGSSFYRVNADGTGLVGLYTGPTGGVAHFPNWSPDGRQIVFAQSNDVASEPLSIYTMNADGSNPQQVTHPPSQFESDALPSWQPIPGPQRSDYKNAAQFCQADRDFLGDQAFADKYGTNGNGANAYGKCVSQNQ